MYTYLYISIHVRRKGRVRKRWKRSAETRETKEERKVHPPQHTPENMPGCTAKVCVRGGGGRPTRREKKGRGGAWAEKEFDAIYKYIYYTSCTHYVTLFM